MTRISTIRHFNQHLKDGSTHSGNKLARFRKKEKEFDAG
jgi:hypothetical protein